MFIILNIFNKISNNELASSERAKNFLAQCLEIDKYDSVFKAITFFGLFQSKSGTCPNALILSIKSDGGNDGDEHGLEHCFERIN